MENISRRAAIGSLLTLGVVACSPRNPNAPASTQSEKKIVVNQIAKPTANPNFVYGHIFLAKEIEALPDSPIKRLLLARTLPIFRDPNNKVAHYDSVAVNIASPRVTIFPRSEDQMIGHLQLEGVVVPDYYHTLTASVIARTPYPFLATDEEIKKSPTALAPDGKTATLQISYNTGSRLQSGIGPVIGLNLPKPEVDKMLSQQGYDPEISTILIKEAATYLAIDLYLEEIIKGIRSWRYPLSVASLDSRGAASSIELPSLHLRNFWRSNGRFMATTDLAGYVLATHALKDTSIIGAVLAKHPEDSERFDTVLANPLGTNGSEIVRNAYNLVMTNPKLRGFTHLGDFNKVP